MEAVRADKWLWAVRLFKTRGLAAKACEAGRVKRGEHALKPASSLHVGDLLEIPFPEGPGARTVRVLALIEQRVGAPIAKTCCQDLTTPEMLAQAEEYRRQKLTRREGDQGRPTKRNRRQLEQNRGFFE